MKIQYLSDLHVDFAPYTFKVHPEADVIIIAGDMANLGLPGRIKYKVGYCRKFFAELAKHGKPIVSVPGNHCYYGLDLAMNDDVVREAYGHGIPGCHILMDESIVIDGVRFFGSVLWPAMNWYGKAEHAAAAPSPEHVADFLFPRAIQDFQVVRYHRALVTPDIYREHHTHTIDTLLTLCNTTPPDVVITHTGPTKLSVHENYENHVLNPFFANDLNLKEFHGVKLWIHGHTHHPMSYDVDGVRVRCNPRGYPGEDHGFNPLATEDVCGNS